MRTLLAFLGGTLFLGVGLVSHAQNTAANKLPVELFARYDEFGRVRLSPDGETIAVATAKKRNATLSLIGLQDSRSYGNLANDRHEFGNFEWVSNTRIVYTLSEYFGDVTVPQNKGEMLAIDRDLKNHAMIYGYRERNAKLGAGDIKIMQQPSRAIPTIISTLRADDKKILIAEQKWREDADWFRYDPDVKPSLTLLDVYTGDKQNLGGVPLGGVDILLDSDNEPRFAAALNGKTSPTVVWKPSPKDAWKLLALPGFRAGSVRPRLFDDDDSVFVTAAAMQESYAGLYRVNLKTQAIEKIAAFPEADIDTVVFDFSGRKIVGIIGYADKPEYRWFDDNDPAAQMYIALQRAFPKQNIRVNDTSADGKKAIVIAWSDTNPGDVYLFDSQTAKTRYLYSVRKWIDPKQMRPKEPFALKARDGLELHGYLTRPAVEGPYPLVVLPHDGPATRDYFGFDPLVQLLANRGYAVLQINFRGSSGLGIDFEAAGHGEWGGKIQDDITDATRWALDRKLSTPGRICIYGQNFGAYAALMGAVREPTLYRCAIGEAGIYDLELLYSKGDPHKIKSVRDYLDAALGADKAQLRTRSPVYNAQTIEIPILLIHGKEEWRADVEHAKRMQAALEKNKKSFESIALSREGQVMYDEDSRRVVYERVLAFLDKHLPVQIDK